MNRRRIVGLLAFLLLGLLMPASAAALPPIAVDDVATVGEDDVPTLVDVLSNDILVGLGPWTILSATNPANGTVEIAGDALTLTYDPDPNYNGPDTFEYVVTDGTDFDTGSVDVTVTSVNDDPVADDDSYTIDEDVTTTMNVRVGDTDVDGDTLDITAKTNGSKGVVTILGGGTQVSYDPNANANGADTFTYTVDDGNGGSDTATVSVTIDPVNDDPVADADSYTIDEDVTTTMSVRVGDTDIDGDGLTVTAVGGSPTKGTASVINGGDDVSYDPDSNATGSDTFTYTVSDGNGGTDTATVSVTITSVDDLPNANDDNPTVIEDTPTVIDVRANDTDPDDPRVVTAVTQGTKGAVTITNGGDDVTYVPNLNATGSDSFDYTITAGGETDTATVHVTITGSNDPPDAVADAATFDEDATTDIDVRGNDTDVDGDTLTITITTDGAKGTTSVVGGDVRYTPTANANGADTFSYTISDGNGGTDTASVTVTITAMNDAPIALDDDFGVAEDALATPVLVLAGDTDPDNDPFLITAKTNGAKGTVAITGGGTGLTYKPGANQSGGDSFTYTISDGLLADTATVTVTIGGANDPPNAVNDPSITVPQGAGPTVVAVLANDSDPDGDALVIISKTDGAHGGVSITGGGTGLTYNPSGIYKGTDTFKYTVSDGHGGTDQATVVVTVVRDTVKPVITAPVQRFLGQTVGTSTTKMRISWSGTDTGGTGIGSYKLQVSVNGGTYATVSLSSATATFSDRTLTTGKSYRFRLTATDKEGNIANYVYGTVMLPFRYTESSSLLTFVGPWPLTNTSAALNGHSRYAVSTTKRAVFKFKGWDVGWLATRYTSSGKAEVYIDGVLAGTVDLDRSSTAYRQLVFQRHFATLATHTLELRPVGDGRVDIDGFVITK